MIASDTIKLLSGGGNNTDPDAALGGEKSSEQIVNNTLENLFANVGSAERVAGSVKYRCFYFSNIHDTETLTDAVVFISSQTPSTGTAVAIGLDPAGVGDGEITGVAGVVSDEDTAPDDVAFSSPSTAAVGLPVGDLAPGEGIAVWIRRTVTAGANARATDPFTLAIHGKPVAQ